MEDEDKAEAIEWARHCPDPMLGPREIKFYPVIKATDFGNALVSGAAALENRFRKTAAGR